jgi:hypothetical protein
MRNLTHREGVAREILNRFDELKVKCAFDKSENSIKLHPSELVPPGLTVACYEYAEELKALLVSKNK